jgi:hypothetical protein
VARKRQPTSPDRLADEALTQLTIHIPDPINNRLDELVFLVEMETILETSRRELVAALVLAADDPDVLASELARYEQASVGDVALKGYPPEWILLGLGSEAPRWAWDYAEWEAHQAEAEDERFLQPIPTLLREALAQSFVSRVGIALPVPLSARIDALIEAVEWTRPRVNRQDLLSLLIFLAPDDEDQLVELLGTYRKAGVDAARLAGHTTAESWTSPTKPPRGRRVRPRAHDPAPRPRVGKRRPPPAANV